MGKSFILAAFYVGRCANPVVDALDCIVVASVARFRSRSARFVIDTPSLPIERDLELDCRTGMRLVET